VHFRRHEVTQAIACAERCLKLDPNNSHYHAQLDRFRAAQKSTR
jgi:hypothetical protein